jgi:hypothetical protein
MTDRPFPQRVPLQSPIRQLRVEHEDLGGDLLVWRVWLTANKDFTLGTFLELDSYGHIKRITWHEDGTESSFSLTEMDSEDKRT